MAAPRKDDNDDWGESDGHGSEKDQDDGHECKSDNVVVIMIITVIMMMLIMASILTIMIIISW